MTPRVFVMDAVTKTTAGPLEAVAAMFQEQGYTSPNRHDMIIAVLGDSVRVAEVGTVDGQVAVFAGESSLRDVEKMFSEMPDDNSIGYRWHELRRR